MAVYLNILRAMRRQLENVKWASHDPEGFRRVFDSFTAAGDSGELSLKERPVELPETRQGASTQTGKCRRQMRGPQRDSHSDMQGGTMSSKI